MAIAISCGYFFWYKPTIAAKMAAAQKAAMPTPEITVINVTKQKVELTVELPGRVNADKISTVRPQINGVIKKVKFTQGSFVKQGQQLYEIDSDVYSSALQSAQKNLKAMAAKKARYQNLLEQDAISKQEFDDIQASESQAKSDYAKAKKDLDYTKVLAPISGYIGKTNYTEGALVTANQSEPLVTITQLDPVYVDLQQATADVIAAGHHKNVPVTLVSKDQTLQKKGTLKFSEKFADQDTDSVNLRAVFSNKDQKLLPGMFVTAKVHLKAFNAVTIPQRVTSRVANGGLSVFVVQPDNTVKMRVIKADKIFGDSWIVEEGLEEGEIVVYEGFQKIADGAKIKPVTLKTEENIDVNKPTEEKKTAEEK